MLFARTLLFLVLLAASTIALAFGIVWIAQHHPIVSVVLVAAAYVGLAVWVTRLVR